MAPTQLTLGSRGPFNPNWRLQGDRFQRDIVYRRPIFRRRGILRYVTRVAAFPWVLKNVVKRRTRARRMAAAGASAGAAASAGPLSLLVGGLVAGLVGCTISVVKCR